MTKSDHRRVQVLVVGAGPVGLFAALSAARAGLNVQILDQSFRGFGRGYAALLHPRALLLMQELGLAAELTRAGKLIERLRLRADDAEPVTIALPSPGLAVAQKTLEDVLLRALRAEGVGISAPLQATTIQQDDAEVRVRTVRRELVTLGSPACYSEWEPVESSTITAEFVIGADGYDSRVRSALGIEMTELGSTETFAMFEFPVPPGAVSDMEVAFTDGLGSALLALPNGRARFGFQLGSGFDAEPDLARLKELVRTSAPWFRRAIEQVDWGSVIHFERRLARRFGVGRVWLTGDAAHVTSPFGAQSMNLGISEAHDLVCRIRLCTEGKAATESLVHYGAAHQREWHKLLGFHVKFDLLPNAPPWLASHARRLAPVLPVSGGEMKSVLSQVGLAVS
jgi:2-polyprenyl-6-methoxyphenol hydroxylase-like FAD-dependent oxidoreductase